MVRKMFLLVMLGTFLAIGGFGALKAQDPAPQTPTTPPERPMTAQTNQVDLSGTYAGTFNCDAAGLTGDTTLTITGNTFTTTDGKTGRIIASRTRGYTAVALQMAGASSRVISFRGKKSGNKLTLTPITGSTDQCSFTTGKTTGNRDTPTGTTVANPTQSPSPSPTPESSPTPGESPSPMPSPTPGEPMPSPTPSEPMPSPTPSGSPSPSPTPSPSPRL